MKINDIYIRRISQHTGSPNKTSINLYELFNQKIKEKNLSEQFGEIEYITVIRQTKLDQEDYVGLLCFKNRNVHVAFVKVFSKMMFDNREMVLEVNALKTSEAHRTKNKKRFEKNMEDYFTPRYYNQTTVGNEIKTVEKLSDDDNLEYSDDSLNLIRKNRGLLWKF